ncbi:MAG: site-specific DNA-methyltransferase [Patescibacteria group bacterium]|nr:site-specific DNA-methyltransferase [Patescibacteria group bacterium]
MIIKGNALTLPLPDESIQCVVTSPPYWGLRKYAGEQITFWGMSADGESDECAFGLEATIEAYVEHSILILREVRRVLRDDGLCWWNLGDSYCSNPGNGRGGEASMGHRSATGAPPHRSGMDKSDCGLKPLDLCLIPERVALAAQADGWYVRSLVIWSKPNPMPESVNGWRWERHRVKVGKGDVPRYGDIGESAKPRGDYQNAKWSDCPGCEKCSPNDGLVLRKGSWRPTDAYEHILMLAKTAGYFGDAEAVKEAAAWERWGAQKSDKRAGGYGWIPDKKKEELTANTTRNLRNIWTFPTQPYPEAHFATFPERLPEICIKASTSEKGCCPKCKSPIVRIKGSSGWRPSCSCNAGEPVPCTVLEPFGGSGTTAQVASQLGRRVISIDLAYHDLARKRIDKPMKKKKEKK